MHDAGRPVETPQPSPHICQHGICINSDPILSSSRPITPNSFFHQNRWQIGPHSLFPVCSAAIKQHSLWLTIQTNPVTLLL